MKLIREKTKFLKLKKEAKLKIGDTLESNEAKSNFFFYQKNLLLFKIT